jgi:hypothetical protein
VQRRPVPPLPALPARRNCAEGSGCAGAQSFGVQHIKPISKNTLELTVKDPAASEHGEPTTAGPRPAMAGGRSPVTTGKQPASKSGSCVMPSQPVPDLTGSRRIKLNQRVSLRLPSRRLVWRKFVEFDHLDGHDTGARSTEIAKPS